MPKGSFDAQANAQCPFYRTDDIKRKRIICEGIVEHSTLAQTYDLKHDYLIQLTAFCCEHYKKCEIYRMIMATKYDEEET